MNILKSESDKIVDDKENVDHYYALLLGQILAEERKRASITQKDLAKKINLKSNYISLIENGDVSVRVCDLMHYCSAINVSVIDVLNKIPLFQISNTDMRRNAKGPTIINEIESRIVKLPKRDQETILLLVKAMLRENI